jgi:Protein of unknown function (DUF3300)
MTTLGKLLRGSCAIATSGALVLSSFSAIAQDQPPPSATQLPRPEAQGPPPAGVQPPQPAAQQLGQAQLEKLLAPIALYPDDLVAQILTASTYPIEVVEASRWVSAHPNVHGDAVQDAMQQQPWDPSVKGLTTVPQVLAMMNDQLNWTQQLGEAFLAQPDDVSNAIQQLRAKAQANGNLKSSDKIRVSRVAPPEPPPPPPGPVSVGVDPALLPPPPPPEYIVIEPVDPGVYYVPIYDPYVVYGPWLWPAYEPFYWYPPGYVVGAAVIGFSVGFFVGSALWCHYNWGWYGGGWRGGGPVTINVNRYNQFNHTNLVAGRNGFSKWQFNAAHRGSVGFQNATLRQQYGGSRNLQGSQGTFRSLQGTQGASRGTLQGNRSLTSTSGGTGPVNANRNLNPKQNLNANRNASVDRNIKANQNLNANRNANVDRSLNVNRNNQKQNVNQNRNINRNANFNRNMNGGGGNANRGGNFARSAGSVPRGGNGGKGGGNKGHH